MNNIKVNTPPKQSNRVGWISYARVITMLFVILGHCTYYAIKTNYGGIDYSGSNLEYCMSWKLFQRLVGIIYIFHMPMFAMISGMCFNWTLKKIHSFMGIINNKAYRLLIPFVFAMLFVSIPIKYMTGYWAGSTNVIRDVFVGQVLLGGNSHLWFLVSLFDAFLISYLLGKINFKKGYLYYVFLFIVSIICCRFHNWLGISGAIKLLLFFEIGRYYFEKINKSLPKWRNLVIHIILFCIISNIVLSVNITNFKHGDVISQISQCLLAIYGCFVLVSFSQWVSNKQLLRRHINTLDKDSFGMYLFSDPFNYAILAVACPVLKNSIFTENGISITMFIMRFFITLFVSVLVTRLIRNCKI